jgi:DNA processing protein
VTQAPLPQAELDDRQRLACLRLIRSDRVGPASFRDLINHCGGAEQALEALPELARRGGGRTPRIFSRDAAERELAAAAKAQARTVFTIEPGYPALLAATEVPPPVLYIKGQHALLSQPAIAIVGSRDASAAGQTLARTFAAAFGATGFIVASGLARGIDAAAHQASIATGTIAVVAGGIDVVYPPEHASLQERIAREGCLISEQPPGYVARAQDFPRRNRIISGISYGVLIVEAARRSGTLTTARYANEQGRLVFAVPGHPLDPRAEGTNHLLKQGALLTTTPADVIDAVQPQLPQAATTRHLREPVTPALCLPPVPSPPDDDTRTRVLAALGPAPTTLDDLARTTGLPVRTVRIAILELTLAGHIERHGQQLVSRVAVGQP